MLLNVGMVGRVGGVGSAGGSSGPDPNAPTLDLVLTGPTLDPRITFTRAAGPATYFDVAGVLQTAGTNVARFDYDPVTHAARGLLIEEARTNVFPQSNLSDFTVSGTTTAPASGVAPDGTNTMLRLVETTANSPHYIQKLTTISASTTYVLSVFAKAAERQYLQLFLDDGASNGAHATFDLTGGTITGPLTARAGGVIGQSSMQSVGNGIWRCSIATTIGASTASRSGYLISPTANPGFAPIYTGIATNGLLVWGADLEQGAYPTTYIPTTGALATRAADAATMPIGPWFNSATSSLVAECNISVVPALNVGNRDLAAITDGTTANRMALRLLGAAGTANTSAILTTITSAVTIGSPAGTVVAGSSKFGGTWNGTRMAASLNGGAATPNGAGMPTGLTTMQIGNSTASFTAYANAAISRVRYWPRALSDAELQSVTS